jgi:hypothetical protein
LPFTVSDAHATEGAITAAEDFAYMLEACPGAFINIGNADSVGGCPAYNPITISTTLHCLLQQIA